MTIKLIFVDDDLRWQTRVDETVVDWNREHPDRPFSLTLSESVAHARTEIASGHHDCALLDLKMPRDGVPGPQSEVGVDFAEEMLASKTIPIAIFSGNVGDRGGPLENQPLVQAFSKAQDIEQILKWFDGQRSMMLSLRAARTALEKIGAEIFLRRIWPRWEQYGHLSAEGAPLDGIITRQFASHIAELMGIDNGANPGWHPMENYIQPALLDHRPHTGDIFRIDEKLWVVLTPQCDMAMRNTEQVLLAKCEDDAQPKWDTNVRKLGVNPQDDTTREWFRSRVNQNVKTSLHFLPPLEGKPLMVNFNALRTIAYDDLVGQLGDNRIASISPPFLGNLTQRFGAFMARPGQPNIEVGHFGKVGSP